jgi:hypothetical protein
VLATGFFFSITRCLLLTLSLSAVILCVCTLTVATYITSYLIHLNAMPPKVGSYALSGDPTELSPSYVVTSMVAGPEVLNVWMFTTAVMPVIPPPSMCRYRVCVPYLPPLSGWLSQHLRLCMLLWVVSCCCL